MTKEELLELKEQLIYEKENNLSNADNANGLVSKYYFLGQVAAYNYILNLLDQYRKCEDPCKDCQEFECDGCSYKSKRY